MHRKALVSLLALAVFMIPVDASAADKKDLERAEARATEGKAYFKSKLYKEAAEAFMDAYAIVKKPTLVYNAARAREESGDLRKAVALFTMYTGLAGVDQKGKTAAGKHIDRLSAKIKAQDDKAAAEAASAKAAQDAEDARRQREQQEADKQRRDELDRRRQAGAGAGNGAGQAPKAAARPFPVYRAIGGGALGIFAVVAQVQALSLADDAKLSNLGNGKTAAEIKTARDAAPMWQGIAIGSGVIAAGLMGWAAYDYLRPAPKTTAGRAHSRENRENSDDSPLTTAAHVGLVPSPRGWSLTFDLRF